MKLAYSLTHPRGKILGMVLTGIFAFVQPNRPKTTLHKIDYCSVRQQNAILLDDFLPARSVQHTLVMGVSMEQPCANRF